VAVLGAGAVGLATAHVLQERGHPVRVIAKDFPPHTTSNLAGAEWLPFGVANGNDPAARARFARLVRVSWTRFRALLGDTWGVHERPHFDVGNGKRLLADVPHDLIPPPRPLDKLPFAGVERSGERFTTMLIEPPTYLAELLRAVLVAGATLQARTLHDAGEVQTLPEKVVVDCMGLGAAAVFGDDTVVPVRGQLVHVFPQPLPYLLSHEGGYLFPRRDCIVLGGTYEVGVDVATPDQRTCAAILDGHRRFFAGG
jgi:glycine/D-amino acid oxidase-like deaminating enzyme